MKGIIYCRVSSQEQTQGTSLENQKEACLKYAEEKDIKITKIFIEKGESATAAHRTELIKALDYCRENKSQIGAFIVWKVDRFARNTIDHYGLQAQLMKYGTTLHSATEPMINEGPVGKVLESVLAGFAQFENDVRKMRCEGGMQRKIKEGIWPWQPPIGYIHSKKITDRRKTRPDESDQERFYLIEKGLKEYAQGKHNIISLTEAFNKWGFRTRTGKPMFKQKVERILRDKFYAGILVNPWTKEEYQGLHKPMITLEEYNQIQFIKSGLSNNAIRARPRANPDFPLRGLVACICGKKLTGSWHTGRSKKYSYYHCNNPECERYLRHIGTEELREKFLELLNKITPKEKYLNLFKAIVIDIWNNKRLTIKQEGQNYERELKRLETQKEKLLSMRMNSEISKEDFLEMKEKLENQIIGIQMSRNEAKIEEFDIETAISYAIQFMKNISRQWQDMDDIKQKQRLQKLVLTEGITYDRTTKNFGTAVLSPVFRLFEDSTISKSRLVAEAGIAPATFWL